MSIKANQIAPEPVKQTAQPTDPTISAGEGIFYPKEVLGVVEAFFKNGAGQVIQLTKNGELLLPNDTQKKLMVSSFNSPMSTYRLISITSNGSIVPADSDDADGQMPVGIILEPFSALGTGQVILFGKNVAGALVGYNFAPGKEIFLDESNGYTDDTSGFTGNNDSIIRVGVSAMGDGLTGTVATDLILMHQIIVRPPVGP